MAAPASASAPTAREEAGLPALRLVAAPRAPAEAGHRVRRHVRAVAARAPAGALAAERHGPGARHRPGAARPPADDPRARDRRLVKLAVREGSFVERGDLLAEMADQDPQYSTRLEQQYQFALDKVEAARGQVEVYDQQLNNQERGRRLALDSAQFALNVAIEKVKAEEQGPRGRGGRPGAEAGRPRAQVALVPEGRGLGARPPEGRGRVPVARAPRSRRPRPRSSRRATRSRPSSPTSDGWARICRPRSSRRARRARRRAPRRPWPRGS